MLIVHRRPFTHGLVMAAGFVATLVIMFLPLFGGHNAFQAADRFFNSVAKHSGYHIPALRRELPATQGHTLTASVALASTAEAERAAAVLTAAGVTSHASGVTLRVEGDLSAILGRAVDAADATFGVSGSMTAAAAGTAAREELFAWWQALHALARHLTDAGRFEEARVLDEVIRKGIEVSYNFYGIEPRAAGENAGVMALALALYLLYTLWWGYAILWLSDGLGLEMKASVKHEA